MKKNIFFKFIILLYGRIYFQMTKLKVFGMKDPPSQARFSALAQAAILFTLNVMAIMFMIVGFFDTAGLETPSWMTGRIVDIALLSSWIVFFLLIRSITDEFDRYYEEVSKSENTKALRRFVVYYPYLVVGAFLVSVVLIAMK